MANSSQNMQDNVLRIGVIKDERVVDEIVVREKRIVTIGSNRRNLIVVEGDDVPDTVKPFRVDGDEQFYLHVLPSMTGHVSIDDATVSVEELIASGRATPDGDGYAVPLNAKSKGKISLDGLTFLFQFVAQPPAILLPPLPPAMKASIGYLARVSLGITTASLVAFLISTLLHGGLVGAMFIIPPPPRADGDLVLNARLTRMLAEPIEEEPTEVADAPIEDDGDIIVDDAPAGDVVAAGPDDSDSKGSSSSRGGAAGGDSSGALTGINQVIAGSAFGALMNADGGLNLGLVAADSASERSAAEALAQQQASGGTGAGGVVAENLGGIGSGTGDGTGRLGVGGDGSSAVADAARASGTTTAQEQVRVKPNVGDRGQRMAGSGSLSESEVRGVLGRFQRRVERCYERTLASNPSASGRVELRFRVDDKGESQDARLEVNELGDSFGQCILSEVRRLRFSPPSGGSVTVSQRYILQPGR